MLAIVYDGCLHSRRHSPERTVDILAVCIPVFVVVDKFGHMFLDDQSEKMVFPVAAVICQCRFQFVIARLERGQFLVRWDW